MNIDELKENIQKDIKIDITQLDVESVNISSLTNKYLNLRMEENIKLRSYENKAKIIKKERWEYYTGKADIEVYRNEPFEFKILKQDIPIYLESDKHIQAIQDKIFIIKEKIKYIESIITILNNKSFNISNAIKWKIFTNGGME